MFFQKTTKYVIKKSHLSFLVSLNNSVNHVIFEICILSTSENIYRLLSPKYQGYCHILYKIGHLQIVPIILTKFLKSQNVLGEHFVKYIISNSYAAHLKLI